MEFYIVVLLLYVFIMVKVGLLLGKLVNYFSRDQYNFIKPLNIYLLVTFCILNLNAQSK